ncbi:MAG: hypothetical protein ACREDR_20450 [Blastocatellia bacterium]
MFTIELRRSSPDVCPHCENTGVVLPGKRKLLTDSGEFCSCAIGVTKWEVTKETMAALEYELAVPSLPPPPTGRYRESSRSFRLL